VARKWVYRADYAFCREVTYDIIVVDAVELHRIHSLLPWWFINFIPQGEQNTEEIMLMASKHWTAW
jgi:hypothetical protein